MKQRVTDEMALQVAREYLATKDMKALIRTVSDLSWHFGRYCQYNRDLFIGHLLKALSDKGSNQVTAQRVSGSFHEGPVKCPGCNWETQTTYWLGPYPTVEDGHCASCFVEALVTERRLII